MMHLIDRYFIKQPKLRRLVTFLLEGNRESDVQLLGAPIRVHSIKEHGYLRASRLINRSALLREELPVIINLAALFKDGDTFIDIGANVGIYSLTLARIHRVLSKTNFYAFEANPDTFHRLSVHTHALGIKAYNLALSDCNGSLEFVAGAVSHIFTTIENASEYSISNTRVSVACRRLDEISITGDSLILKIDVEGQEQKVLHGALGLFKTGRIKAVYLDGYKNKQVVSFLREQGFSLFNGKTLEAATEDVFHLLALRDAPPSEKSAYL